MVAFVALRVASVFCVVIAALAGRVTDFPATTSTVGLGPAVVRAPRSEPCTAPPLRESVGSATVMPLMVTVPPGVSVELPRTSALFETGVTTTDPVPTAIVTLDGLKPEETPVPSGLLLF